MNLTAKGMLLPFKPIKPKPKPTNEAELAAGGHAPPDDIGLQELYAELKDTEENGDQEKNNVEGFVKVLDEMTVEERE